MKRILITGSTGFIGSSLADFIEKELSSYEVYGIDIRSRRGADRYFKGDIRDRDFLKNVLKEIKPYYIFHFGGSTNAKDLGELVSLNISTTGSLLDTVSGIKNLKTRIIIPGSAAEYGCVSKRDMPVKEGHVSTPINFYGMSKALQTFLSLAYYRKGLDVMVGRIFNVIGRGTPTSLSVGRFAHDLSSIKQKQKSRLIETGDLDTRRDFVDINDVCSAMIAIARKGRPGNIYNICSGRSYKLSYVLNYLCKLSGLKGIKIKRQLTIDSGVNDIVGSNKKIKKDTGWEPKISISESLKDTLNYYWNMG